MAEILLSNQVMVYLLSQAVLFVLHIIASYISIQALLKWDFSKHNVLQFSLEKRAYLGSSIAYFIVITKLFLLAYFVFTLDSLALLIPGAMCGAGVLSSSAYGSSLLLIKLLVIAALLWWFLLHSADMQTKDYHYLKAKNTIFLLAASLILVESILDIYYFFALRTDLPVSCCSTLFGQLEGSNPLPFGLDITLIVVLFYLLFVLVILSLLLAKPFMLLLSTLLFVFIGYYTLVYFFGIYIYALPTHKCPFCMLQSDYNYVGYILWASLFIGGFLALAKALNALLFGIPLRATKAIAVILSISVVFGTFYVLKYYLQNGVWL